MLEQKEKTIARLAVTVAVLILIGAVIISIIERYLPQQNETEDNQEHSSTKAAGEQLTKHIDKLSKKPVAKPKKRLIDIIRTRRTWNPTDTSWYGHEAPDILLTDINGKEHKLSDYRGKNVLLIFWATWCGPCIMEIPHLIELRKEISEDKLVMLAISNEHPDLVKRFAEKMKINYTVFSHNIFALPAPFGSKHVLSFPFNFYIDLDGKIKMATTGLITIGEIRAILEAEK